MELQVEVVPLMGVGAVGLVVAGAEVAGAEEGVGADVVSALCSGYATTS